MYARITNLEWASKNWPQILNKQLTQATYYILLSKLKAYGNQTRKRKDSIEMKFVLPEERMEGEKEGILSLLFEIWIFDIYFNVNDGVIRYSVEWCRLEQNQSTHIWTNSFKNRGWWIFKRLTDCSVFITIYLNVIYEITSLILCLIYVLYCIFRFIWFGSVSYCCYKCNFEYDSNIHLDACGVFDIFQIGMRVMYINSNEQSKMRMKRDREPHSKNICENLCDNIVIKWSKIFADIVEMALNWVRLWYGSNENILLQSPFLRLQ